MFKNPSEIEYGVVRDMRYLPDYGRFEAKVMLHLKGSSTRSPDVQFFVNVSARQDERFEELRMRLVLKAARMFRLHEAEQTVITLEEAA